MKKTLLIDSSYPINVRNIKIIRALKNNDSFDVSVVSWNRTKRDIVDYIDCKEYVYFSNISYGNAWKKLFHLISYFLFIQKVIIKIKPDYIIASHWDMLFVSFLLKKNSKLIYENLDMPTSNYKLIYKILRIIEKISLKKTDTIIFASRFFSTKYNFFKKEKIIIENCPFKDISNDKSLVFKHDTNKIKLSFIGNIRYFNVMKNFIEAVKDLPVDLLFFGDGPDYSKLMDYSKDYSNIFFFGRYDYSDIKNIYDLSDIILAAYPSKDINVKYAISNKFFESIIFSKPGIYSSDTELGNYVHNKNIGIKVDCYSINNIRETLHKIISDKSVYSAIIEGIEAYKENNKLYWEDYTTDLLSVFNK